MIQIEKIDVKRVTQPNHVYKQVAGVKTFFEVDLSSFGKNIAITNVDILSAADVFQEIKVASHEQDNLGYITISGLAVGHHLVIATLSNDQLLSFVIFCARGDENGN